MFGAFKNRRPWAAALIALVSSPFTVMLYLNRGRLALFYLAIEIGAVALLTAVSLDRFFDGSFSELSLRLFWLGFAFSIIGAVHAISIARTSSPQRLKWYSRWYAILMILSALPVTALVIRTFLVQPFNAPSASMSPTINDGDFFFVKKYAYNIAQPERGDVVVFDASGRKYVKRIVGVAGDSVQMKAGHLFLNGKPIPAKRVGDFEISCSTGKCEVARQYIERQPNGHSYRIIDQIQGGASDNTPIFVIPPSSYFLLGDNRDNSADSRNTFGYIARGAILGKAEIIYVDGRNRRLTWEHIK